MNKQNVEQLYLDEILRVETDSTYKQIEISRLKKELRKLEDEYIGNKEEARRLHQELFNLRRRMGK